MNILWALPVPSTALFRGASFEKLLGRACSLSFEHQDEDDSIVQVKLIFDGVQAFKCTYLFACTIDMVETAYDRVVDLGSSEWLVNVQRQVSENGQDARDLKHLRLFFDSGPCYEFICSKLKIDQSVDSQKESSIA